VIRLFSLLIICCVIILPGLSEAVDRSDEDGEFFYRINQLYKEGRFKEAVDGYLQLIKSHHENSHLYYNLGNAYYRLNQLGHAILYYEKARLLMPRDADLDYNLRYVRQQTKDMIEENQDALSMSFFWLDSVTLSEIFWIFAVINFIFWSTLLFRLYLKKEWTYYLVIIFLVAWIIVGISFGWKWHAVESDDRAVILAEEVNVLSGPDIGDTILFKLHAGTIVRYEREEDEWMLIRMHDRKRGWIRAGAVGLVKGI